VPSADYGQIGELADLTITFRADQDGATPAAGCRYMSRKAAAKPPWPAGSRPDSWFPAHFPRIKRQSMGKIHADWPD
jgi:hypothetical protein